MLKRPPLNKQLHPEAPTEEDLKAAMDAADAEVARLKTEAWLLLVANAPDLDNQRALVQRQEELKEAIEQAERRAVPTHQAYYAYFERAALADDRGPAAKAEAALLEQRQARTRAWLAEVGIDASVLAP